MGVTPISVAQAITVSAGPTHNTTLFMEALVCRQDNPGPVDAWHLLCARVQSDAPRAASNGEQDVQDDIGREVGNHGRLESTGEVQVPGGDADDTVQHNRADDHQGCQRH